MYIHILIYIYVCTYMNMYDPKTKSRASRGTSWRRSQTGAPTTHTHTRTHTVSHTQNKQNTHTHTHTQTHTHTHYLSLTHRQTHTHTHTASRGTRRRRSQICAPTTPRPLASSHDLSPLTHGQGRF